MLCVPCTKTRQASLRLLSVLRGMYLFISMIASLGIPRSGMVETHGSIHSSRLYIHFSRLAFIAYTFTPLTRQLSTCLLYQITHLALDFICQFARKKKLCISIVLIYLFLNEIQQFLPWGSLSSVHVLGLFQVVT